MYRTIMPGRGAWPYLNVHLAIARFTVNRQMRCTGRPRSISVLAARPNRRIPWRSPSVQMPMKHLMRSRFVPSACLAAAFAAAAPAVLHAQTPEPLNWTAQQDHKDMMEQLGITRLRPGPSGNASATNAANYDPAKANP